MELKYAKKFQSKCKTERNELMRFNMELDENLIDLYEDLQAKRYKQRGYRLIYITVPIAQIKGLKKR